MNHPFFNYVDTYEADYRPLLDVLSAHFGTEFEMIHTGGGLMAIQAVFESGHSITVQRYVVMITDAQDGGLCPWQQRVADTPGVGFSVGVYGPMSEALEPVGWASDPHIQTADQLIDLIKTAFDSILEEQQ